ncbi:zinc uptake transcriptional repressor Zur [Photobacterium sp. WH77]|uniref:Ferric uptake regulation protein n=1 Tax=Photobacterium arenosum TaxID=2774143 RepID=A0ABR9BQC3_9GAMM|nr:MULTISPECIES: zinc uptake transcriptional repressor Zur [Photobacterium]MBD8514765.1 zinc uptake transcriptional repressor Zur [Photobacterium arenosum]MBV7264099.1 zinc uptake transcriptional repressor Zur [Photobacterium sp. WH24]MCG2838931.1 zinc uptake transcriptional repressor Zur [Photobacterium sp. WH77]MCG2846548.1 zinc uptake transcriptional repressor Zur [Photobacterium sp. WH80]MDO6583199.1 zinc uptake transcriptional repressor Zur [Photobacterium sp. 2_MG-2023]
MANHMQLLNQAQTLCDQRGVRLTPQRQKVLELIVERQSSISAYELLDLLRETEPQAKPPTVYRALDFLLAQGFVHKVESTNSYIACNLLDHASHCSQLLICDECSHVEECHDDELAKMLKLKAQQQGFQISHHVVESHGVCQACQHKK